MISDWIFEYAGVRRGRKQVMNHVEYTKSLSCQFGRAPARLIQQVLDAATEVQKRNFSDTAENDKQIHRIQNATSMLAFRNQEYPRSSSRVPANEPMAASQSVAYQAVGSFFSKS
jgi:hypothetical protein